MWFWRSPHKLKTAGAVLVATTARVAGAAAAVLGSHEHDCTAPAEERDNSQQGRLHFWQVAVAMANDRPLPGVGHNGYERAYNTYDFSDGQYDRNRAVHSAWFGVLGEFGYPGLLLFVADHRVVASDLPPGPPGCAAGRNSWPAWAVRDRP